MRQYNAVHSNKTTDCKLKLIKNKRKDHWNFWNFIKPNTHRRRDSSVKSRRVGGVYWIRN